VGSPYILGHPPVRQTPGVPVIGWVTSGGRHPRPLAWAAAPEAAGATPTTVSAMRLSGPERAETPPHIWGSPTENPDEPKKMAYGFRNREHFKTAIYFHCGGLDLYPVTHGEAG
jgi:hypothetical protein